jgi:hypothetical protein
VAERVKPVADAPTGQEKTVPQPSHPAGSVTAAIRLIWVRLGRWIAYPLLIIATLIGSYATGHYFFAKAGHDRGFREGRAYKESDGHTLITSMTRHMVADSIRDDARNSIFAQAGLFDYLRLAAFPRDRWAYGDEWQRQLERLSSVTAEQWLVARFVMVPANKLVTQALVEQPTDVPWLFPHDDYVDKINQLSSNEWPTLAADLELDTVLVPVFEAISPVIRFHWCYMGADRLHYVVEP